MSRLVSMVDRYVASAPTLGTMPAQPLKPQSPAAIQAPGSMLNGGNFDAQKHPRGGKVENKGEFSKSSGGSGAGANSQPPTVKNPAASNQGIANSGIDHAQRHAFTKSQLGSVHESVRGIMVAFHAHPEVQAGGASVTQAFAPDAARQAYAFLRQNVGTKSGGAGAASPAVDLGQGRLGYASPAGSIIVWPADSSGRHQIKYTNQTGVVARAMGSGGQAGQRPAAPSPGGQAGSLANPVPPPVITPPAFGASKPNSQLADQRIGAPPPQSSSPFAPPVTAERPPQPGFEPSQATPEQLASASALTEKPTGKPQSKSRPGGPQTPREIANATKQQIEAATGQWHAELAGGLSTKGNARWRSYLAALNSIHGHQEKLAKEHERQAAQAQRAQGKRSGGPAADKLTPHEEKASKSAPDAFAELQGMREGLGEAAYHDAVKQLAGQRKPWEGRMLGGFEGSDIEQPPEKKTRQPVPAGAIPPAERSAMSRLGIDPATGKPSKPQIPAGAAPPSRREREARMREQARAGFETPAQEQPPSIEGSDDWKRLVKQKASEWDMQPHEFHSLADDLHKELVEHQGQRKAAYLAARKSSQLAPADVNKLENEGFDYGSAHPKVKQLDTIGRELASEYPALGWGRGREDEGNDEGRIDYAEKVWELLKGGYQPPPGKHSPEFMEHVEDYLRSQLKHHGSSGTPSGAVATNEDLSSVPFTMRRALLIDQYRVERYAAKWDPGKHPRGDDGRFVVSVSDEEFGNGLSNSELRTVAYDYAMKSFRNKEFINKDSGKRIKVSRRGINKTCSHLPDRLPLLLLAKLPDLLRTAKYIGSAEPDEGDKRVAKYHYFNASVRIDGAPATTMLKAFEDMNGHWYYDQHVTLK